MMVIPIYIISDMLKKLLSVKLKMFSIVEKLITQSEIGIFNIRNKYVHIFCTFYNY